MGIYLLKSTAILAIFWTIYVLLLERENMHRFKRFYLLTSIIAAVCIPLFTITEFVYVQPVDISLFQSDEVIPLLATEPSEIVETSFWNLERTLWAIYAIGVIIFTFRFSRNLTRVFKTINTNETHKQSPITFVLLKQLINPHTFFNYIFLNKTKFENRALPKEVILHEETHAKQKHSLDILFIELLQIVFWFQPLIWLYKTRIKLNHEFLADQAVIDNGFEPANYQNTLLSYSSNDENYTLANAINYSSIKKRFSVMKTQTSQKKKWLFSLLVLPILGILFYSFSDREIIEVEKSNSFALTKSNDNYKDTENKSHTARSISIKVLSNGTYDVDGITANRKSLVSTVNKLHQDISSEIRNKIINIHLTFEDKETNEEVWFIYNSLKDYGFHRLVTKNQEIIKSKGNMPFSDNLNYDEQQKPVTLKEIADFNNWAKNINSKSKALSEDATFFPPVDEKKLVKYLHIYKRMTEQQKAQSEKMPFPGIEIEEGQTRVSIPSQAAKQQKTPTAKEVAEYNAWAKKMKAKFKKMPESEKVNGYPHMINDETFRYYNSIYDRMSKAQKDKVESLPEAVLVTEWPMPTAIVVNKISNQQNPPTKKEVAEYNAWAKKMSTQINKAETDKNTDYPIIKRKDVMRYKSIYSRMTEKQLTNAEAFPNIPPPPPPPPIAAKEKITSLKAKTLVNGKICEQCEMSINDIKNLKLTTDTGLEITSFSIKFMGQKTLNINGNRLNSQAILSLEKNKKGSPFQILNLKIKSKRLNGAILIFPIQQKNPPTAEELAKYNTWAKRLNDTPIENRIIKSKDFKYYESIFDRMSAKQKKNAQPLPVPPPPPPPPAEPKKSKSKGGPNPDFYDNLSTYILINVKWYLKKYNQYEALRNQKPHYINKTKSEQKEMDALFSDLGGMYFRLPKENKKLVERPIAPIRPYVKISLNGKTYYKKFKELTREEKETLPPPPPPVIKKNK